MSSYTSNSDQISLFKGALKIKYTTAFAFGHHCITKITKAARIVPLIWFKQHNIITTRVGIGRRVQKGHFPLKPYQQLPAAQARPVLSSSTGRDATLVCIPKKKSYRISWLLVYLAKCCTGTHIRLLRHWKQYIKSRNFWSALKMHFWSSWQRPLHSCAEKLSLHSNMQEMWHKSSLYLLQSIKCYTCFNKTPTFRFSVSVLKMQTYPF